MHELFRPLFRWKGFEMNKALYWQCGSKRLSLQRTLIMGIVNVTPDSFSDGGKHNTVDAAVNWGCRLAQEGADILDVGGESTRPGAVAVTVEDELQRVIPVVEALASCGFTVSVDTSKAEVMRAALSAGASILNDVRAFEEEGALQAAANSSAGLVIMHMHGTPNTGFGRMQDDSYLEDIESYLMKRQSALQKLGVSPDRICWDAGFGFGKSVRQNFGILAHTQRFVQSGQPYLLGLSRKSSLGAVTGVQDPGKRMPASIAGALLAAERGAQIVRVHDVKQTRQALDVWQALCQSV